ncbi:polyphosphate kinase 2 family protein [Ketobacter sp.]|uniref:polyphosphate kinase 2 family protein n=1 Tax=Ketobacter sp. TaxID=2083498 RepID=UPI0025BBE1F9|nr:PPK2 family polyphosphate kinase [Ketobacter sp.]
MKVVKLSGDTVKLKDLGTSPKRKVEKAREKIDELQLQLLRAQQALFREGKRVIILMEGTDTAGKGGVIRRLTRHLDPRGVRVWPIGAPAKWEQSRHYLYRFWQKLPEPGEITIFDRSWYGRVLVERVEGFASEAEWGRAYRELAEFERQLTDDGVVLIKLFLNLSKDEQYNRFMDRLREPTKRWKITTADLESRHHWSAYQNAYEDMLNKTATKIAPWYVIPADNKQYARVKCLSIIADQLEQVVDTGRVMILDPKVIAKVIEEFGEDVLRVQLVDGKDGKPD